MPDNATIRKYIRHPTDMPIRVVSDWMEDEDDETVDQTITNVSLGGLAFISPKPLEVLHRVRVSIPVLENENYLVGNVVWCEASGQSYEIGIEFEKSRDVYRMRMIEQICHIEHYRNQVAKLEGREISAQEAAREWIARYADDFPAI